VKTKYKHKRRILMVSGGFFLALLLGAAPNVYADDRAADRPAVDTTEGKNIKRNEQPMEPATTRDTAHLVGPSGEDIHDFLYPAPENPQVVTSAN
jgi:hypothetical protein